MNNIIPSCSYNLFGHSYVFGERTIYLDGDRLGSRVVIYNTIMSILKDSGFRFSPVCPVPPVLVNYMFVRIDLLKSLLRNIVMQLASGLVVSEAAQSVYVLNWNGFCIKLPLRQPAYRICVVEFFDLKGKLLSKHFAITPQLSNFVDAALSRGLLIKIS